MNMIERCSQELSQHDIIMVSSTIMFIFTPKYTLVATPLQLFMITYGHRNYSKRLSSLRGMVENGVIKSMSDLISYNGLKAGHNSQMYGLELVRMEPSWVN